MKPALWPDVLSGIHGSNGCVGPAALLFHYYHRHPGRWPGLSHSAPLAQYHLPSVGAGNRSMPVRKGVPPFASIRVHSRFPSPTPTALCHAARGCADPSTTPGPGQITSPTPSGVVPSTDPGRFVPKGQRVRFSDVGERTTPGHTRKLRRILQSQEPGGVCHRQISRVRRFGGDHHAANRGPSHANAGCAFKTVAVVG